MRSKKFLRAEQAALIWDAPGLIAGVDEAGRGPLAGPVVAAAVILDDLNHCWLGRLQKTHRFEARAFVRRDSRQGFVLFHR